MRSRGVKFRISPTVSDTYKMHERAATKKIRFLKTIVADLDP